MYIKKFNEISIKDIATVGGKGASLGEMSKAGFSIPPGFVVITKAFSEFHNKTFSESFKKEVFTAFVELKLNRVAVRSSAVAEDSESASWAGQLESYLNVTKENLLENISLCFKSIESSRAQQYAKDKKVEKQDLVVAVVIQKMVDSEISGVMFTANPVTANINEIVIEAGYGLGEFIVQGIISPDNYLVDKNTNNVKNKDLGSKEKMYIYKDGENKSEEVAEKLRRKFTLSDTQVNELCTIGKMIEKHFGFPCDIEWAFEKNKFYVTQSRPITTLEKYSEGSETNIPKWDNASLFRWGPMPGKVFYLSDYVEAASRLKEYFGESFPGTLLLFHDTQMIWICVQKEMSETGAKIFSEYILNEKKMNKWHKEFDNAVVQLEQFQEKLKSGKIGKFSRYELLNTMEKFYDLALEFWLPTIPAELGNYGSTDVLREHLTKFIKTEKELDNAVQILTAPENLSYNQQEEIELSIAIDLDKHLKNYFWLQNNYSGSKILNVDFFEKRKNELNKNLKENVEKNIKKIKDEKSMLIKKYRLPKDIVVMSEIIWQNIIWQDYRKKLSLLTHYYRFLFLKKAAELLNIEIADLENYSYKDIIAALGNGELKITNQEYIGTTITNNLSRDEAEIAWNAFTRAENKNSKKDQLSGTVASKGETNPTIAKVKIVIDPSTDDFPKGSVLVTPTTSPEFVILMRKSAAVVTNTGGLTSHAAIVSRELGIPCIVGTKYATEILNDGDLVKIDTESGYVTKVKN